MTLTLAETPLTSWHAQHGGRLVDFAGWSMPVQYNSIVAEHNAVRQAVGLFDVSHMGRIRFNGNGAAEFLDSILTRGAKDMPLGAIRYSLICNEAGGILDDVLLYHLQTPDGRRYYMLVVNACSRDRIVRWIDQHLQSFTGELEVLDRTAETAMIAVQGPRAMELAQPLVEADLTKLKYYHGVVTQHLGRPCTVSRTGYTGEDGVELIVRADDALATWNNLLLAGRDMGIEACGLGARDTLRLEAAMPLYGHELSETITPIQAGLNFAVKFEGREFVGRDALITAQANRPTLPYRVGLVVEGRRVPREHFPVLAGGETVGEVTSGTFSPTLQEPIAMAYVPQAYAAEGTALEVDIRGRPTAARVVKLPFYRRAASK